MQYTDGSTIQHHHLHRLAVEHSIRDETVHPDALESWEIPPDVLHRLDAYFLSRRNFRRYECREKRVIHSHCTCTHCHYGRKELGVTGVKTVELSDMDKVWIRIKMNKTGIPEHLWSHHEHGIVFTPCGCHYCTCGRLHVQIYPVRHPDRTVAPVMNYIPHPVQVHPPVAEPTPPVPEPAPPVIEPVAEDPPVRLRLKFWPPPEMEEIVIYNSSAQKSLTHK
jgi:hypothetical protein